MLSSKVCQIFRMGRQCIQYVKLDAQMEHEDHYLTQAPWPPRSKIKVARSPGASGSCWPLSRDRKVPETPKLVERLRTPRAIMQCTNFKVTCQGQQADWCWERKFVISSKREIRHTNVKLGTHSSTKTRITDKRHGRQGQRSKSRCHVVFTWGVHHFVACHLRENML